MLNLLIMCGAALIALAVYTVATIVIAKWATGKSVREIVRRYL